MTTSLRSLLLLVGAVVAGGAVVSAGALVSAGAVVSAGGAVVSAVSCPSRSKENRYKIYPKAATINAAMIHTMDFFETFDLFDLYFIIIYLYFFILCSFGSWSMY